MGSSGRSSRSPRCPAGTASTCGQGAGNGGPPTIADFDGDGQPEIGVADLDCYTVFEVVSPSGTPALTVKWSKKVQDHSSSVTGSSVFDFEGDGKAEVVYADEVALHVYNGADGVELFNRAHCSGTTYEYPVIVDVNANGRADLVVIDNTYAAVGLGCDPALAPGIQVFHDAKDNWVNTRQIWNQHAYHVTNVCDGADLVCGGAGAPGNGYARVPKKEPDNWSFPNSTSPTAPPLNNYRQNVQGEGLFNSPDLTAKDLRAERTNCPASLSLEARVVNRGALGVLGGIKVAFFLEGTPRTLLGMTQTTQKLLPGQSERVAVSWEPPPGQPWPVKVVVVVDDDGSGKGTTNECVESNNLAGPIATDCAGIN